MKEYLIKIDSPFLIEDDKERRKTLFSHRLKADEENINAIVELIRDRLRDGELFLVYEIEAIEEKHLIHSTTNI
jgi:hypothetical protein